MTSLRCRGEQGCAWLAKSIAYACTAVFLTRVTSPNISLSQQCARWGHLPPLSRVAFLGGHLCQGTAKATRPVPFLCVRTFRLPARTLPPFVRLPGCSSWQIPCACERVWYFRGALVRVCVLLFARDFPVSACVLCLALGRHTQLR